MVNHDIQLSDQGLSPTHEIQVVDEFNRTRQINVAGERPLIIRIDGHEIVTLMTLGTHPEALVLGYLRNQRFITDLSELVSIIINWETESAEVITKSGIKNLNKKIANRVVTTGCGQGTVFSCTMDEVYNARLAATPIKQSVIYQLLRNVNEYNTIYKSAGAVHGCALCRLTEVLIAIEDVGRHNAADAIAGLMWLNDIKNAEDLIFYTTGRVTSEIVMKVSQMGISVLLSRSGVTHMGLDLAEDIGMLVIARAKGKHFLVFSERERMIFDVDLPLAPQRNAK